LTLRHADSKTAGMDWLYHNACKVTDSLMANEAHLNMWDEMDQNLFINELIHLVGNRSLLDIGPADPDSSDDDDDAESVDSTASDRPKLGTDLRIKWDKRFAPLAHDFAVTGWVTAVDPKIRAHVNANLSFEHKQAVERLHLKLFLPDNLTPAEEALETSKMIDELWDEYGQFNTRRGPAFGESRFYIWGSADIKNNLGYNWHKNYSLVQTKQLGRLACRVSSKLLGMGNAERCWGNVKQLKDGQRSHLSAEKASKASTIYGAACAERAATKKPPAHLAEVQHWEQADLDSLGLNCHGVDLDAIMAPNLEAKVYKCYTEDWEHEILRDPDNVCEQKFLTKYGGLVFQDGETLYTGHRTQMFFTRQRGNARWMVFGCKPSYNPEEEDKDDYKCFEIDDDFHGIVFEYYRVNPDPLVKIITPPEALDENGWWNLWLPDEEESAPRKRRKRS
jgi:hypothetical protein